MSYRGVERVLLLGLATGILLVPSPLCAQARADTGQVSPDTVRIETNEDRPEEDTSRVRSIGEREVRDSSRAATQSRQPDTTHERRPDTIQVSTDQPRSEARSLTDETPPDPQPGVPARQSRARSSPELDEVEKWKVPADTGLAGPQVQIQPSQVPAAARDTISTLSVSNADLRNVLRGIGEQYGVNLIVDDQIQKSVTLRLSTISVLDAIQLICREHDLTLIQTGPVFRVRQPPEPPPTPPNVTYDGERLTLNLTNDDLSEVAEAITQETGHNVIVSRGVEGTLDGFLREVPLESGLSTLLDNNGYSLRKRDGIYVIDRKMQRPDGGGSSGRRRSLWVNAEGGKVDLQVEEAPIQEVLREVAAQMELDLVTYSPPQGRISATVNDMSVEEVFDLLFQGNDITYRRKDSTYFVGNREMSSVATTELVVLDHVKAERIPDMLPSTLKQQATIKVIAEQNGLMITGTNSVVEELRRAVEALDQPTPLILIEALVVDFTTTDLFELGLEFGQDQEQSEQAQEEGYRFGEEGFQLDAEDEKLNQYLQDLIPLTSNFGIRNIGELPEDFFFKLRALSEEGKVDIRSRPQVATLSGHEASIEIGQTQYFILRKETPIQTPGQGAVVQETERFEQIEANVSLQITPWVTSSGEVTTKIRPEFSQPVGTFNAEVPPTINTRILESTVRLREGETIILGGLIRDQEEVEYNKIPLLGSIPFLGRLFRSRSRDTEKSELVIYLTPHVFYGEEDEPQKWEQLREEKGLRDPKGRP